MPYSPDPLAWPLTSLTERGFLSLTKKHYDSFSAIGVHSLLDLLLLAPKKVIDKRTLTAIADTKIGTDAHIEGVITNSQTTPKTQRFHATITDQTGVIQAVWFHSLYLKGRLFTGARIRCYGRIIQNWSLKQSRLLLLHPSYQLVRHNTPLATSIECVYQKIDGVSNSNVKRAIQATLQLLDTQSIPELLCLGMKNTQAFRIYHYDADSTMREQARQRLGIEEFFAYTYINKHRVTAQKNCFVLDNQNSKQLLAKYIQKLPFTLTKDQLNVCDTIINDMKGSAPMFRLLQGDVGCGKTVIALLVSRLALAHNWQICILTPTTILAQQHYTYFSHYITTDNQLLLLTSSSTKKHKTQITEQLKKTSACILIATHAALAKDVQFASLGILITDEQHRFGVVQRSVLSTQKKDTQPHQLLMTATPIPRTLLMSIRGDLAISNITQLPKGRKPIRTSFLTSKKRQTLIERVYQYTKKHQQQAYWVCTLIDETDDLQYTTAYQIHQAFCDQHPDSKVALIHGQLKSKQKQQLLQDINQKNYDIIVATTVVEVGVHLESAAIIVIENPERLGLAQLHQLRGRVGRGNQQAYCVLLTNHNIKQEARERLTYFAQNHDGFAIAEYDFKCRGGGNVFGTEQSGKKMFRITDLYTDVKLAQHIKADQPPITAKEKQLLVARWFNEQRLTFAQH